MEPDLEVEYLFRPVFVQKAIWYNSIEKKFIASDLAGPDMGRDGDGECKDFSKGVCFRGTR